MTADKPAGRSVVDQLLASDNREVHLLIARGLFPLAPSDLVEIQVKMCEWQDPELATAAKESLASLDSKIAADVVSDTANADVISFFGEHQDHPLVVEAIVRNRHVTARQLEAIAGQLSPELQEILLLRQDLIVESPGILDHLERNPRLSTYSQRRIHEFREHLVRLEPIAAPSPEADDGTAGREIEEATDQEVEDAIRVAREIPAAGETDEVTGLSEAQIRSLPVPVRMKLARGAPRSLRAILIKDKSPMVAVSVFTGNAMTESEVELIASNRSVSEEVLTMIANNRQWGRKYNIVHALVRNPRTSVGLAVRLTPRLSMRDMRNLSRDRNVPEAVRNTAARLYRIKAV